VVFLKWACENNYFKLYNFSLHPENYKLNMTKQKKIEELKKNVLSKNVLSPFSLIPVIVTEVFLL
jgi:hypothetical protein